MDIFGIVLVDPWKDNNYPKFNKYLVEKINAINPTCVFINSESGEHERNVELIDQLNCPIKSYFGNMGEWMKSGLLIGNWLYVGCHWGICVHVNVLGLLNLANVWKYDSDYNRRFNILVRPDLLLHKIEEDYPDGSCSKHEIINDRYLKWQEINAGPDTIPYYRVIDIKQNSEGKDHVGNQAENTYDNTINRKNDKRLT